MRLWLVRNWFLLLLLVGLCLAVGVPHWLEPLTQRLPMRWAVGLSLCLAAWPLPGHKVLLALARPRSVLWAVCISYGLLPLFALGLGWLLPMVDLQLGLFLIACVPCTLSSAVLWTRHAGGDEAMALLLVVVTTASAWLVTPLWLTGAGPVAVRLDGPRMMGTLALVLVVPVGLGQAVRLIPGVPAAALRYRILNGVIARLVIAMVLIAAAVDASLQVDRVSFWDGMATLLACGGLHLTGVLLGLFGGRVLGLTWGDRIAVGFAASQKTLPVGLLIFGEYYRLDHPLAVLPLLAYHAGQLLIDTFIAERLAGRAPAE